MKIGDKVGVLSDDQIAKIKQSRKGRLSLALFDKRFRHGKPPKKRKFPKSKSIRTVSGGLPSLGKRRP